MPAWSIVLNPTSHRFFRELVTAQAATAAFLTGHQAKIMGVAQAYQPGAQIIQVCFTQPASLCFEPAEILGASGRIYEWPSEIHLTFQPGGGRLQLDTNLTAVQTLMASLYESAFIAYVERNVAQMKLRHGRKKLWPEVLRFGRVVRNAFAHGGTVHITDGVSAEWGGISYTPNENGRRVLYNDLSAGDLTMLMIEMDKTF